MAVMKIVRRYPKYAVTDQGAVFSYASRKWLKQQETRNGYRRVELSNNGVRRKEFVHRLVASEFLDPDEAKPFVNHIDSNRSNNWAENLEWCTPKENTEHMIKLGRHVSAKVRRKRTHCRKGHEYTPSNTCVDPRGGRHCRSCKQAAERNYWLKRRDEYNRRRRRGQRNVL